MSPWIVCSSEQAETNQLTTPLASNTNFYISNCIKHNSNNFRHVEPSCFALPAKLHPISDSTDKPQACRNPKLGHSLELADPETPCCIAGQHQLDSQISPPEFLLPTEHGRLVFSDFIYFICTLVSSLLGAS